jgi:hypothetical protein
MGAIRRRHSIEEAAVMAIAAGDHRQSRRPRHRRPHHCNGSQAAADGKIDRGQIERAYR